ncbi:LysR family transcriptional regulator [Jejubacter calystegiae]|nr:LysR family transcriptional regulator [Jejubacter calystegiae]
MHDHAHGFIQKNHIIALGAIMDLHQLRCFLTVAQTLHFGQAAQRMDMLPSALGRHIRLLEESLGTRLFTRSTRRVALTDSGLLLREEARKLLAHADALMLQFRQKSHHSYPLLRVGAIDSAAIGLLPQLIQLFKIKYPEVEVQIYEDKTVNLLPKILNGRLDIAFIRPPEMMSAEIAHHFLCFEPGLVAVPQHHSLAAQGSIEIRQLENMPMIVPERRSRPHSHDMTMNLFHEAGIEASISQVANEKQTIINLVAAGMGLAIVPLWISRFAVNGVKFLPIASASALAGLPLSVVWLKDREDDIRQSMLQVIEDHAELYGDISQ